MSKRKAGLSDFDRPEKKRKCLAGTTKDQRTRKFSHEDYTVGWVCALFNELAAARLHLDTEHDSSEYEAAPYDDNAYVFGSIGKHNVVLATLPKGQYGTSSAASVAQNMIRSFTNIRVGLMVGIGGGAPLVTQDGKMKQDIRLGDVVVSTPGDEQGGVYQYDYGKKVQGQKLLPTGHLNSPPLSLGKTMAKLHSDFERDGNKIDEDVATLLAGYPKMEKSYQRPDTTTDQLYKSSFVHSDPDQDCTVLCNGEDRIIERNARGESKDNVIVHYGLIASGNTLMKDAILRDTLATESKILCFEMEAAGLMNQFPFLVVRGICDYSDSHKNKVWQGYAAMTAAAYSRKLLLQLAPGRVEAEVRLSELVHFSNKVDLINTRIEEYELRYKDDKHHACHRIFKTSDYEGQKNVNPDAVPDTCQWVFRHPRYRSWLTSAKDDLLWVSADPGCGKSVLSKLLIDIHRSRSNDGSSQTVCYFFFKDNEQQNSVSTALSAIVHQLFSYQPRLIRHALPAFDKSGEKLQHDTHELWRIIQNAANDAEASPIICILDALDECREVDRALLIDLLCRQFRTRSSASSSLKWLVTSRPYDEVRDQFETILRDLPSIRLRGEDESEWIRKEINLVIHQRVQELSQELRLSTTKTEEVLQQLLRMEQRTYLWLHLAIPIIRDSFRDAIRPRDKQIIMIPATVDEAYERILARVSATQKENAMAVLTIIVGARRPLTVEEMALALDIATLRQAPARLADLTIETEQLGDNIRRWCGLFVLVSGGRLYLLHQTAKEFLLRHDDQLVPSHGSWKHCLSSFEVEKKLATICMHYLCLSEFNTPLDLDISFDSNNRRQNKNLGQNTKRSHVQTLFRFAAEHWASHTRAIEGWLDEGAQTSMRALYDTSSSRWIRWTSAMWQTTEYKHTEFSMNFIHLTAFNGHHLLLGKFLKASPNLVDSRDRQARTGLWWASERGFVNGVQQLLDVGADVNVNAQGGYDGTALQAASANGHDTIVQTLLGAGAGAGADVNAQGRHYSTALQAASANGHDTIVQILLGAGADVNAQGGYYGTALQAASVGGHDTIVQVLLDAGADVNAQGRHHGTALRAASANGHDTIVRMLLSAGADVNAQGRYYDRLSCRMVDGSALQAASASGHDTVVQTLYRHGAIDKQMSILKSGR